MKYKYIQYLYFIILLSDSLEMVKISFRPNPDYKYMYDECVYQMKEQNKSLNQTARLVIGRCFKLTNSPRIFERRAVTSPTTLVSKGRHCNWDQPISSKCSNIK